MKPRRGLVEANGAPSMRRQCELLGVNRSSLYYEPVEPDTEELELMRRMDELHLKHPFFGSRMMTRTLKAEGVLVNRKRVQRLMRLMGLASTAPKPNTEAERGCFPGLGHTGSVPWGGSPRECLAEQAVAALSVKGGKFLIEVSQDFSNDGGLWSTRLRER